MSRRARERRKPTEAELPASLEAAFAEVERPAPRYFDDVGESGASRRYQQCASSAGSLTGDHIVWIILGVVIGMLLSLHAEGEMKKPSVWSQFGRYKGKQGGG